MHNVMPREPGGPRVLALALLFLVSCGSPYEAATPVTELPAVDLDRTAAAQVVEYRIKAGDELDIRFFHTPVYNVVLPVRPDGRVSLPLVREIQAAGRTPTELEDELIDLYTGELRQPAISVIVLTFRPDPVHVGGAVGDPGVFPLTPSLTVYESITEAGGLLPTARLHEVLVIRQPADGPRRVLSLDLMASLDGTDPQQNIPLQPYDIVYVPLSSIAEVNKWVDQYIRQNIPVNFSVRPDINP